MNVRDTITAMMRTEPAVHTNRVKALFHLFEHCMGEWVDGQFNPNNDYSANTPFVPADVGYLAEALASARPEGLGVRSAALLERERHDCERKFVYEHAATLAVEGMTDLDHRPRFTGRNLDTMPDDVSPDWLEAGKEVARAVIGYWAGTGRKGESFDQVAWKETFASRRAAEQFLERVGAKTITPAERAARLASLQREAWALGVVLEVPQACA